MPQINLRHSGRDYWRSLDELADTEEFRHFMKEEFPGHNAELDDSVTRRSFLKIMGASFALAGLTACQWPEEKIAPYAHRDADIVPGTPRHFATTMDLMGSGVGLLVTSFDNRPVKIEGNPSHPHNLGKANLLAQASILELYDPDRSRHPVHAGEKAAWSAFDSFANGHFGPMKGDGEGIAVLTEQTSSPAFHATKDHFKKTFPNAKWYEYEAASYDNELEGSRIAFGKPLRAVQDFGKAKRIVCLDADPLMSHPAMLSNTRAWSEGRRDSLHELNRMYCVESTYTVTGSNADHRFPVKASDVHTVASHLLALVAGNGSGVDKFGHGGEGLDFISVIADDLKEHKGESVVVAGPHQPAEVHALVHKINEVLGNTGETVSYAAEPGGDRPSHSEAIKSLADDMAAKRVGTLLILGGNPVLNAPADLGFGQLLANVETKIHLSLYDDETSELCDWHLNRGHFLETWGDGRSWEGFYSIQQPLIAPLFDGRSPIEILALAIGEAKQDGYSIVRGHFGETFGGDFETTWRKALHDGFVESSSFDMQTPSIPGDAVTKSLAASAELGHADAHSLEIVFRPDYCVHDGRFANNAWLQELPDPMTKLTWDNAAHIDKPTADSLGIKTGDRVSISVEGREIKMAAYVMPGQAPGSIALSLGYGRERAGQVALGAGFNVYPLRGSENPYIVTGAKMENARGHYQLATTQDHHAIDQVGFEERFTRAGVLIRELTLEDLHHDPEHVAHMGPHVLEDQQLWEPLEYNDPYQWGMTIDLNTCIGCNACVIACQSENNIAVVGKEQVLVGRELHWMRIDRYYRGADQEDESFLNPSAVHQPMLCQHCENAPCESVCPVAATLHDDEGLNVMVYNRCIGTRYCSNNCPYKVRRFNYFNYAKRDEAGGYNSRLRSMQYNPEVTVRERGVMEKCSYCTQRIQSKKIEAKNDNRPIQDGEIVTACQQTCPTNAIVFGNLNDPNSELSKNFASPRQYEALSELNVNTRTRYMAKLNNPNPALVKEHKTAETNEHSTH